jgi:preprotein translocase subunit SecG
MNIFVGFCTYICSQSLLRTMNKRLIILSIYFICCKLISIAYHQRNTSKTNKTNEHTNKQKQNKTKTNDRQCSFPR